MLGHPVWIESSCKHKSSFFRAATRSDMMTPLNRSVARVAKPGERLFLVSDNSSPIVDGTYTATKGRAKRAIKPAKVIELRV